MRSHHTSYNVVFFLSRFSAVIKNLLIGKFDWFDHISLCVSRLRRSRLTEKRKSPEVDGDGSDEEEEDNDTCCVCGGPVPPALRHKTSSGNPTIQWAKCDSCQSWVHLQYCSKVRKVSPDDEFICPSCQPSTK